MDGKLDIYMKLLLEWNEKMNLTAITEPSEIVVKHFLDSLTCAEYIPAGARVADVGTGAGFPGIPLKIERADIRLTLIDSLQKRVSFLKTVCREAGIEADCVHIRAEDAGRAAEYRETFDVAVSRAVASLSMLSEYCLPLVKRGGLMLAMKGKDCGGELNDALPLIEALGGSVEGTFYHTLPDTDITHSIVVIKKISDTPQKYPRKSNKIGTKSKS